MKSLDWKTSLSEEVRSRHMRLVAEAASRRGLKEEQFHVAPIVSWDNTIYVVRTEKHKGGVMVARFPTRPPSARPPQHSPATQAAIARVLQRHGVVGPTPLEVNLEEDFLLETYVEGSNFGDVFEELAATTTNGSESKEEREAYQKEQREAVFVQLGGVLRRLHSIKTEGYGLVSYDESAYNQLRGISSCWLDFCEQHFMGGLRALEEAAALPPDLLKELSRLYHRYQPYLAAFDKPCLVHADLNDDNIRVILQPSSQQQPQLPQQLPAEAKAPQQQQQQQQRNKQEIPKNGGGTELKISGLLDFCDSLSGDPLYDFGSLLEDEGPSVMGWVEQGYGEWSQQQKELIFFYAIFITVYYMTEGGVRYKRLPKYTQKLRLFLSRLLRNDVDLCSASGVDHLSAS
ncbi:hypothetical protein QOT17_002726 [Balamuthia mandrillaris]